ncbi:MAG: ABC transporter permease [Cyclobacteriaceae bacterium]
MKAQHSSPPNRARRFLKWFCNPEYLEDIEGDLLERFDRSLQSHSPRRAQFSFTLDVLRLFRPSLMKPIQLFNRFRFSGLVRNQIIASVRTMRKEKSFSILNIICLTIGIAACLYAGLYSYHQLTYDHFHEKADRIYRINQTFIWGETDDLFGSTGPAVMDAIQSEIPEFEVMTRIHTMNDAVVSIEGSTQIKAFEEGEIRGADPTFFDVFSFPLIHGNPQTALAQPNSVVITEKLAKKYFGTTDILGKNIKVEDQDGSRTLQITGVAKDVPNNSHVTFSVLISLSSLERLRRQSDTWWWTTFVTFGVLRQDANPRFVADKVAQVPGKFLEPFLMKYQGMTYKEFIESGKKWDLYIQPLLDIHLKSTNVYARLNETKDIQTVYLLNGIAGLILLLSVINFINITTARATRRAKEVGMRKILGTNRSQLIAQFLIESFCFCLLSLGLAWLLVVSGIDYLNELSGSAVDLAAIPSIISATSILITLVIAFISGLYPAMVISSFRPIDIIKSTNVKSGGVQLRNVLVSLQFTISIGLIIAAFIINNQVQYWLNMDLGFNREHVLVVRNGERLGESIESFRKEVVSIPGVRQASISTDTPPFVDDDDSDFYLSGVDKPHDVSFWIADETFADIYGLKLTAGRNFNLQMNNRKTAIVSQSLIEAYGLTDPFEALGRTIEYYDYSIQIIGVFEDIQTEIRWQQLPIAVFYKEGFIETDAYREISIDFDPSLDGQSISEMVTGVEDTWNRFNPTLPLKYFFLDQRYASIFNSTIQFGKLINFYAIMACIIACLGLTGLVAYVIDRRHKEIGIRKVLGASITDIWLLLTGEFGKLVLIGFALATSLTGWIMSGWVENFTYQAPLSISVFVLSGLLMVLIAVITLSLQVAKAAVSNPINHLRDE